VPKNSTCVVEVLENLLEFEASHQRILLTEQFYDVQGVFTQNRRRLLGTHAVPHNLPKEIFPQICPRRCLTANRNSNLGITMNGETINFEQLIAELDDDDPLVSSMAESKLAESGTAALDALISALGDETHPRCWKAAKILHSQHDPRLIKPLQTALISPNVMLGSIAAKALEKYGTAAADGMISALPQTTTFVQITIVGILEKLQALEAVPQLLDILRTTDSSTLRYTTIRALGVLAAPQNQEVIDLLQTFQDDPDHHVRKRTNEALAKLLSP
jgi:HEAT repeat protein